MSKTKTTLIRVNESTKALLDAMPYKGKGYSNIIEELIHTYKKHGRRHAVERYLLDDNFSEMELIGDLDTYLHEHYKDNNPENELADLMKSLRKIIDDDELKHGNMSKSELDGD